MKLFLAAVALVASFNAMAQAPRLDCSQTKDPQACEERRDKMKAAHEQAQKACEGTRGAARSECMSKQMCAQASDPKACEERIGRLKDVHDKARQACEGRKGAEARECMQKEMCAQSKD